MEFTFTALYRMLKHDEHYNQSKEIEILKGKYALCIKPTDLLEKAKRERKFKK